jgi:myo-inositol catabolism protein IolS
MKVSEVGFGAWAIGGTSYGAVDRQDSLRALAKAEEHGCNFVDTAFVYGDSELVLGEFLQGRRNRWLIATKYSGQKAGIVATLEEQLKRIRIDTIDFYQIHWCPREQDRHLYDDLYRLKASGKVRFIGVSLHNAGDIDYVLDHTDLDGFQVAFSLLDPDPYLAKLERVRDEKIGVIIRSCLNSGFLTGKYTKDSIFSDQHDQRHQWSRKDIVRTVEAAERFRFLEKEAGSMLLAAARYPLSFPETSTVIVGTRTAEQAAINFELIAANVLQSHTLDRIQSLQEEWGLRSCSWKKPFSALKRIAYKWLR